MLILAYFNLTETTISSIDEDDTSSQENTEHLNVQNNCLNSTPIDIYSVERRLSDNILRVVALKTFQSNAGMVRWRVEF